MIISKTTLNTLATSLSAGISLLLQIGSSTAFLAVDPVFVLYGSTLCGARLGESRSHLNLRPDKVVGHVQVQPPRGPRSGQTRILGLTVKCVVLDGIVLDRPGPNIPEKKPKNLRTSNKT